MGSRWRQENHYRYARMHFDLDSHDSYQASDDDPTRMVPNPAKKTAYAQRRKSPPGTAFSRNRQRHRTAGRALTATGNHQCC